MALRGIVNRFIGGRGAIWRSRWTAYDDRRRGRRHGHRQLPEVAVPRTRRSAAE